MPGLEHPGFPIAEMHADGSFVITKHPGTGGLVSVGTVTAQLLYEIGGPATPTPTSSRASTPSELEQTGPTACACRGVAGEPPPPTTKVCINYLGGYRNSMTFVLTGLDIEDKAELAEGTLWSPCSAAASASPRSTCSLRRGDRPDPASNEEAFAYLRVTVKDPDEPKVGRAFSQRASSRWRSRAIPASSPPAPPGDATQLGVYWPTLVPAERARAPRSVLGGERTADRRSPAGPHRSRGRRRAERRPTLRRRLAARRRADRATAPLGTSAAPARATRAATPTSASGCARRGATPGSPRSSPSSGCAALLPEAADLEVERYELPNLLALNFVVEGLLGDGVAASLRSDPQAKSLGEYLRAKVVDLPEPPPGHLADRLRRRPPGAPPTASIVLMPGLR